MNKKRIISIWAILLSVFVISTTPTYAQSKKINLSVGKSKQLNVSMKKVKWKSNNSKIAKVSKNGKIKGIKKGKTKIIAMSGKQKKVFVVKVKNSYYKANFKNVKKMMVRNLNNGQTKEFFGNDILLLQSKLNKNNFYRKISKDKLATGDFDYMFSLYDKNDKLLCSISFGEKIMKITKGKSVKKYISKKTLDISHFEF